MQYKNEISPQQDTGWGLIFRLNDLLNEIENLAPQGKYDDWNYKLDRMWVNLIYRNELKIKKDNNGNIIEMELSDADINEKKFIDNRIKKAKKEMSHSKKDEDFKNKPGYKIAKQNLYASLLLKDIWIRKLMHKNNLYIKEIKHNPAGAMWGK